MAIAPVPYTFQNTPNGFTIPLDKLDANFSYLVSAINGPMTVTPLMLSTGGPNWDATGKLTSQGNLVTGSGNISSSLYPTNLLNIGVNGFTFNVGTSTPVLMTTTGAQINGSLKITQVTPAGVLTINAPNVGINTSFTFPPTMGYDGYVLTTDGAGNTSWLPPQNSAVKTFSTGATGLTPVGPATGDVVLSGILNVASGGTGTSAAPGTGQVLIGNGTGYALNTLTAGPGCIITNGAGSITISLSTQAGVNSISGGTTGMTFGTGAGNVTMDGTLGVANGGTGHSNRQDALNALVGSVTPAYQVVQTDGINVVVGNLTPAAIALAGTLSNNTTGTAGGVSSTTSNSRFNSIGVGVAPTGISGDILVSHDISAGNNIYSGGGMNPGTGIGFSSGAYQTDAATGYGQTWQDVTGSRTPGVVYVNTTTKPIMVNWSLGSSVTGQTAVFIVQGVTVWDSVVTTGGGNYGTSGSAIVPAGQAYQLLYTSGSWTLRNWAELR